MKVIKIKEKILDQIECVRELTTTWVSVSLQFTSLVCLTSLLAHLAFQCIPSIYSVFPEEQKN